MMMCARLASSASKALKNSSCVRSLPAKNWTSSISSRSSEWYLRLQLVEGLALVVLHHVGDELLGVQVEDPRVGPVGEERVADGVDQVRLAEADAAVDEQRVVHEAGRAGDVQRGGARHLVGAAGHQRVEGQRRIEPAARGQRGRGGMGDAVGDRASVAAVPGAGVAVRAGGRARAAQGRVEVDRSPAVAATPSLERALPSRCASVTSRRTGLPASSLSTVSIRPAYWLRIQSSLKRFGTRTVTTAPSPLSATSASGRGRIQVLNCWSGSSDAKRSQPRCQRSDRMCGEVARESSAL